MVPDAARYRSNPCCQTSEPDSLLPKHKLNHDRGSQAGGRGRRTGNRCAGGGADGRHGTAGTKLAFTARVRHLLLSDLRLSLSPTNLPIAMLVLALATAEAIQNATHLACDLRWPNDVLVHEKKVAGILAQFVDASIVAGIGVNVNQTWLPENLRTPASSLRMESNGRIYSREEIIIFLLSALDSFCDMLTNEGSESILRAFLAASSYALNRRVMIEESGRKGITAGLDQNGFLLVRLDDGRIERVATGGIRPDH